MSAPAIAFVLDAKVTHGCGPRWQNLIDLGVGRLRWRERPKIAVNAGSGPRASAAGLFFVPFHQFLDFVRNVLF